MSKLITTEDISKIKRNDINFEACKFYHQLSEDYLADAIEASDKLSQKSYILLGGYAATAAALFGLSSSSAVLLLPALLLALALVLLLISMFTLVHGSRGQSPSSWLKSTSYLSLPEDQLAYQYAYRLLMMDKHIKRTDASRKKKARLINMSLVLAVAAVLTLAAAAIARYIL